MKKTVIFLLLLAFVFIGPDFPQGKEEFLKIANQSINADEVKDLVNILAHQGMGGRLTGTEDFKLASEFLRRELKHLGYKPLFPDFIQKFGLSGFQRVVLSSNGRTYENFKDFFLPYLSMHLSSVQGELIFMGYGVNVNTKNLKYNDYAKIGGKYLKGKIAVVLQYGPREVFGDHITFGLNEAEKRGATAIIVINDGGYRHLQDGRSNWFKESSEFLQIYSDVWMEPLSSPDHPKEKCPLFIVRSEVGAEILGITLDELKAIQIKIDSTLAPVTFETKRMLAINCLDEPVRAVEGRNVLGWLPGERQNEVVVIGAHFDHIGAKNGKVYAGADDNASGTTAVLQIARALSDLRKQHSLKRSVVIAFWGGEEGGLLGSGYFVKTLREGKLPLSDQNVVAVMNLDMVGRNFPEETNDRPKVGVYSVPKPKTFDSLEVARRSPELIKLLFEANADLRSLFTFTFDDRDKEGRSENFFERSDQASFRDGNKQKPAIFFSGYAHPDYHKPTDTPEKINYAKIAATSRLAFLIAVKLINSDIRPQLKD